MAQKDNPGSIIEEILNELEASDGYGYSEDEGDSIWIGEKHDLVDLSRFCSASITL